MVAARTTARAHGAVTPAKGATPANTAKGATPANTAKGATPANNAAKPANGALDMATRRSAAPRLAAGARARRRSATPPRLSLRRALGAVLALALVPVLISYIGMLLQPSNAGLGIRSVEWLREHGAAWLVNDVENVYYSLTAPATGGPALRALPNVGVGEAVLARGRHVAYRPRAIAPIIVPALPGEGIWHPANRFGARPDPVLVATYRPDPNYPRMVAGVAWIDTHRTSVRLFPGRYEPPAAGPRGPLEVPATLRANLLATFNSGFKIQDARGGFFATGHLFVPLARGIATLVVSRDGAVDVRAWNGPPAPGPDILYARQNLPLIINYGRLNPNLSDGPEWGATLGNAVRVWRSGVGVDRRGDLLYAAANDQTVGSLALILRHAGAVRAMELDINSFWVSFISYGWPGAHAPLNLLPDMNRPATRYLTPDDRDFFAVFAR